MPQENSAGAIIYRIKDSVPHYLLLHYPSGHWEFAKGHIEAGENFEKTIRREVEEETGIKDLKILPGFKEYAKYFFKKNYNLKGEAKKQAPWVFKLVVFLLAETKTEDVKISAEHKGFLWLPFGQAVKRITYKNAKELLKKANDYIVSKKVYEVVRKIPAGKVLTYKQIAQKIGNPKASRAVGNALNKNYNPRIPCHRIIGSDGKIGGYNKGAQEKVRLLKQENAI